MKMSFSMILALALFASSNASATDSQVATTAIGIPQDTLSAINHSLRAAKNAGLIAVACSSSGTILIANAVLDTLPFKAEKLGDTVADGMDASGSYDPNESKADGTSIRGGGYIAIAGLARLTRIYARSYSQRRAFSVEENQELAEIAAQIRAPYSSTLVTAGTLSDENSTCQKAVREIREDVQVLAELFMKSNLTIPIITFGHPSVAAGVVINRYMKK